jgi:copper chaperone CopZ
MDKIVLELPTMYGDHHVLAVREALIKLEGVEGIYASSAWKEIMVSFDPKKIKQSDIEDSLAEAGYPVGEGELPVLVQMDDIKRDPQWAVLDVRVCKTNDADLSMSGEFRRY